MADIDVFMRQAKQKIRREIAKSLIVPAGMLIVTSLLLVYTIGRLSWTF